MDNQIVNERVTKPNVNKIASKNICISTRKYPNLKKLFDDKVNACNNREVGRAISCADVLFYFLERMDGNDVYTIQGDCLKSIGEISPLSFHKLNSISSPLSTLRT